MSDATSISRRTPIASHHTCDPQVRDLLQVAWVNDEDPSQGLRYLYLEDTDYQRLLAQGSAVSLKSVNAQVGSFCSWHSKLPLKQPLWKVAACQICS